MRYFLVTLPVFLLTLFANAQISFTPVHFPSYMHGVGAAGSNTTRVPYVSRFTINGLTPNATYRYIMMFTVNRIANATGGGVNIYVKPDGSFRRVEVASLAGNDTYGEFTADGAGTYTGWFMAEPDAGSSFTAGNNRYFRIVLNDGNGGNTTVTRLISTTAIRIINFGSAATEGTAIRSTPATLATAKNFVFLYDKENPGPGDQPVSGTVIESDGIDNNAANGTAPFYADNVNGVDKTWGAIVPNNLADGIKRIVQLKFSDASEIGYKTSANGAWAKAGGGTVQTVNTSGGTGDPLVLDGSVITLGIPVAQPQSITFSPIAAKTYGTADIDPGATASSLLPVNYFSSNTAVATITAENKIHIVGAGTTDIKAEQGGNGDFLAATPVVQSLVVNKAPLTITAENKVKVQGDPLPPFTAAYSGFVNSEDVTALTALPTLTTTATATSPGGQYPIRANGAVAANYTITYVDGVLTVTAVKQPQQVTFPAIAGKTYGAAAFDPGASLSSNLPVQYQSSDPTVAAIVGGRIEIRGVGNTTITASHPGDENFEPAAPISQQLTVQRASLTITADSKTRLVGQANPTLTASYNGLAYNETSAVLTAQPVLTTTATAASVAGNYPINVAGASAVNYTITFVQGVLTVAPLPSQTISFAELTPRVYGDADFAAGAVASSGLPVGYASSNPQVAVVNNGMVKIIGAGTATITASQAGNASNAPAPDVARVLTVQKANLVIQVLDTVKLEGQANPVPDIVYSGFVNNENASVLTIQPVISTAATQQSVAGKYPIRISGAASNNYSIGLINGTLKVLPMLGANENSVTAWVSAPGRLQVNVYSIEAGKATIQLFDQQGTRLQQAMVNVVAGFNTVQLPIGNTAPGIYHIRVFGPEFILKHKLVIR